MFRDDLQIINIFMNNGIKVARLLFEKKIISFSKSSRTIKPHYQVLNYEFLRILNENV